MGYWENTTYLKASDIRVVLDALDQLFQQEGMLRVPSPPQRKRCEYEPMQYQAALENDLWGLAVFPGADSWVVIKSAPLELLAECAPGDSEMRLARLCRMLSTVGFQLHVYDGDSALLCEVNEGGEVAISGFGDMNTDDPTVWHGRALSEDLYEAQFQLLPYQEVIAGDAMADEVAARIAEAFGGPHAGHCDNLTSVEVLIEHLTLAIDGGELAYYRWGGPSRVRIPACSWADHRGMESKLE